MGIKPPWNPGSSIVTINQGLDVNGNNTMDKVTLTTSYGGIYYFLTGLTPSTTYRISVDVKRGSQGSTYFFEVYDENNGKICLPAIDRYSSTSSVVTRITQDFTTPVGCTIVTITFYMGTNIGDNFLLGRAQVSLPGKSYIRTNCNDCDFGIVINIQNE